MLRGLIRWVWQWSALFTSLQADLMTLVMDALLTNMRADTMTLVEEIYDFSCKG
jgi:hypothetical protein